MAAPILLTKLFIPTNRPEIVSRPRLIEQLNHGLHRKLTLISAPAGFGKTTLVTEWLESNGDEVSSPFSVAWFSLDEGDNDVVRFLTYLISALNRLQGLTTQIGSGALQMVQSPQPPPTDAILTELINEIANLQENIVLVLDDGHLIDAQPIHETLIFLIENLPPQLHLVITTREDPPIQISRLRTRGQLNELRALDLQFTLEETAEFLNQIMGLNLSADDIAALESRTEGWIAGLQLAAISMRGREDANQFIQSFTGSNRLVLDYLIDEVLNQQHKDIQTFLLQTSILNRLTGSLCDALTGYEDGQATLEMLERANLFIIPLDDERRWYRYHHLFADLLKQRLNQTQADQVPRLHRQAGMWYEEQGFITEALQHIISISDFAWAANLIEGMGSNKLWKEGDWVSLLHWMGKFPKDVIHSRPELCLLSAWMWDVSVNPQPIESYLESVEAHLDSGVANTIGVDDLATGHYLMSINAESMLAEVAAIRGRNASRCGDLALSFEQYKLALEVAPEDNQFLRARATAGLAENHFLRGEIIDAQPLYTKAYHLSLECGYVRWGTTVALSRLAETEMMRGQLFRAADIYRRLDQPTVGMATVGMGKIYYAWNDLDNAVKQLREGIDYGKRIANSRVLSVGYPALARALQALGNVEEAITALKEAARVWQQYNLSRWFLVSSVSAYQAWLSLAQGDIESAERWAQEKALDPHGKLLFQYERDFLTLARLFIAQGDVDKALGLLQRLLESTEQGGRIARCIEILSLQALSLQALGENDHAFGVLEKTLAMAEPSGYIRVFVDEGPPMARLLYEALSRDITPAYTRQLLAAFPDTEPDQSIETQESVSGTGLVEPLTDRELEVLQLIAEGLTNREVGERLYLAANTVKAHTRTIYSKLGVNNRTQAVNRARALGIISDR
jgi:LuxR family maltose regulon positive regulatory protein